MAKNIRGKTKEEILKAAFRCFYCKTISILSFNSDYRQADKNGDGKLSLEEIIDIFKVEFHTEAFHPNYS
mgnify:FL=1